MAFELPRRQIDPKSGYSSATKTYHTLRHSILLPPPSTPLSISDYSFSNPTQFSLHSDAIAFIDAADGESLTYSEFFRQHQSLCSALPSPTTHHLPPIKKGHVALILSPPSLHIPVLYFSLASLGVVVSAANPASSASEIGHIVRLVNPAVAFVASAAFSNKLPPDLPVVVLDSSFFNSLLRTPPTTTTKSAAAAVVGQTDTAAILFSSGTTGRVKGVELTHRNLIAVVANHFPEQRRDLKNKRVTTLFTVPLFHVFGFFMLFKAVAYGDTVVLMGAGRGRGFDFEGMLRAVERFRVDTMPVSPPLVVAMAKSELTTRYDLSSLERIGCGGAPLGKDVARRFSEKFPAVEITRVHITTCMFQDIALVPKNSSKRAPDIQLMTEECTYDRVTFGFGASDKTVQLPHAANGPGFEEEIQLYMKGYGLTETAGGIARTIGADEIERYGSVGRLNEFVEAKIVDPSTGEALPPGQRGELWLRGPSVMKGYAGDEEATSSTLTPDGWLKTGDICYFDSDGFLSIVDRLKELIKYKAYQVPPAELENVLLSHPVIADAAVIGCPDDEAGEIPVAFVVRKPGSSVPGDQIMDYVSKRVAPYKKIRKVFFTQAIPKSPAGKILRRELKKQLVLTASAKL